MPCEALKNRWMSAEEVGEILVFGGFGDVEEFETARPASKLVVDESSFIGGPIHRVLRGNQRAGRWSSWLCSSRRTMEPVGIRFTSDCRPVLGLSMKL
jgi:hypothetical protein